MAKVLYLTYDGLTEPLGQSQVLSYCEHLAARHDMHILSFEKPHDLADAAKMGVVAARCEAAGITWTPLTYHKAPSLLATLYDIAHGAARALGIAERWQPDIVHCRSYLPAIMGLPLQRLRGTKSIFDIRGFWADERVDGGLWPREGRVFRTAKRIERALFRKADHVVTLTEASLPTIQKFYGKDAAPPISVIPTCADLDRFTPPHHPPEGPFIFGSVGSLSAWSLIDEVMRFFGAIRKIEPDARMLVVSRQDHDDIRAAAAAAGIEPDRIEVTSADHREVPQHIRRMHAAAATYRPAFSNLVRAPTKLAEYLGCGVPCVGNAGVGDTERYLEAEGCGVIVREWSGEELRAAAQRLVALARDPGARAHCREVAEKNFALADGVKAYHKAYESLTD